MALIDERLYLRKLSSATPDELGNLILHAGPEEDRVLRIYLGSGQLDSLRLAIREQVRERGATPARSGNVVVLHGIMGGELTLFNDEEKQSIWVNALRLIQGQFDWLALDEDTGLSVRDVRATGMYMRFYARQIVSLSAQWDVHPFFFDWRRDIRLAADDLLNSINTRFGPDSFVHLVAHSMGGLVARSFIARHPERWRAMWDPDNGQKGGRLVMLGTPNYGSFAIPRLLFGLNDVINILSRIDVPHLFEKDHLLNFVKMFTGIYQMMPVREKIAGLDPLYRSGTYTRCPVHQSNLDNAETFQRELLSAVDPARMVYIAGYNRTTASGIKDIAQLGADAGYLFSKRGDGTVPHSLGILDGVRTFYVDEEHSKLPQNDRVLRALPEILKTGALQNENDLFFGLSSDVRGVEVESQLALQQDEATRRALKLRLADQLRLSLEGRGSGAADVVTPEEQAIVDLLLGHNPPDNIVIGPANGGSTPSADAPPKPPATPVLPNTRIRINLLLNSVEQATPQILGDPVPADCIAVGHYYGVRPSRTELALDRAISPFFRPAGAGVAGGATATNNDLLLTQFHDRGIIRGELGEPFYIPDPRPAWPGALVAIAGMGRSGTFGLPELTVMSRELCWSAAQLGRRHLATVLIGEGSDNLSPSDAIHGWMLGVNLALSSAVSGGSKALEAITFVVKNSKKHNDIIVALRREARDLKQQLNFDIDLSNLPDPDPNCAKIEVDPPPTRISIDFVDNSYRFSALTSDASIPERIVNVDPKLIAEANDQLVLESDPNKQMRLGTFLAKFIFPKDLRSRLTGSAPVTLQLNNAAAQVHWEMAALPLEQQDQLGLADRQFLGLVRGLTRQLRTTLAPPPEPPPPVSRTVRILLVADTCKEHPLPGAQIEAKELQSLFARVNDLLKASGREGRIECTPLIGPADATRLKVLMAINEPPAYDVLHYAGHCVYDEKNPAASGYLFSNGDRLTANELERIDQTPKFVFSNACESGVLPSRLDRRSAGLAPAFAEAFFAKGVSNFICTAWPVNDEAALQFALKLYTNLLGVPPATEAANMAGAMRAARKSIVSTLTWGAYQHYGNPDFRIFR